MLNRRLHPVLQTPNYLRPDDVEAEYKAAERLGFILDDTLTIPSDKNWYSLPRLIRIRQVAALRVTDLSNAIAQYDAGEYRTMKAKAGHS